MRTETIDIAYSTEKIHKSKVRILTGTHVVFSPRAVVGIHRDLFIKLQINLNILEPLDPCLVSYIGTVLRAGANVHCTVAKG